MEKAVKVGDTVHFFHKAEKSGKEDWNGFMAVKNIARIMKEKMKENESYGWSAQRITDQLLWKSEMEHNTYDKPLEILKPVMKVKGMREDGELCMGDQWRCKFRVETQGKVGHAVRYGQEVKLKHVGTERYLCLTQEDAVLGLGLKLGLSGDDPSCSFKITSKYKLRTEGEVVYYQDTLLLQNRLHSLYINYQTEEGEFISQNELILNENSIGWEVKEFLRDVEEDLLLEHLDKGAIPFRAGDLCSLFHREMEGFITAAVDDDKNFKADSDKDPLDYIFEDFLPETSEGDGRSHERYNLHLKVTGSFNRTKDPYSIFAVEKEKANDGSLIRWNTPIRLLHVSSAHWLKLIEENNQLKIVLSREINDMGTLFQFEPLISQGQSEVVTYNSYAKIKRYNDMDKEQKLYISCKQTEEEKEHKRAEELRTTVAKFGKKFKDEQLEDSDIGQEEIKEEEEEEKGDSDEDQDDKENSNIEQNAQTLELNEDKEFESSQPKGKHHWWEQHKSLNKFAQYHQKEKEITLIEQAEDFDVFKIHTINKAMITQLLIISGHSRLILVYLNKINKILRHGHIMEEKEINMGLLTGLKYAIKSLIIEVTSKDESKFRCTFEKFKDSVKFHQPTKTNQRLLLNEFLMQILLKLTSDLWKLFFKEYYTIKGKDERINFIKQYKGIGIEGIKEMKMVCKYSHLLLKLIVTQNKRSLIVMKKYDLMNLLIEQLEISPWSLCIGKLFQISEISEHHIRLLRKTQIKEIVNKLEIATTYNHRIFQLLTNLCAPGGIADKKLQRYVLKLLILGTENKYRIAEIETEDQYISAEMDELLMNNLQNSSLLFYVYKNTEQEELKEERKDGYTIYFNSNRIKWLKEGEDLHRKSMDLEEFLSDVIEETSGKKKKKEKKKKIEKEIKEDDLKEKQRYFKEQLKLFANLAKGYNEDSQEVLIRLFPAHLLLYCLNSERVSDTLKFIIMEFLTHLYIEYHLLNKPPKSLKPKVFTWNSKEVPKSAETIKRDSMRDEGNKLFSLHYCNPVFEYNDDDDWATIKLPKKGNVAEEIDMASKHSVLTLNHLELINKKLKILPMIYKTRNNLYTFVVSVINNEANINQLNWESTRIKLKFYISFFKLLNKLLLREFFAPTYNEYIIQEIEQTRKEKGEFTSEEADTEIISNTKKIELLPFKFKDMNHPYAKNSIDLRSRLIEMLTNCRTQYFPTLKDKETIIPKSRMIIRFEERDAWGQFLAKVKIEICSLLKTIYSINHNEGLNTLWSYYREITKEWVLQNKYKGENGPLGQGRNLEDTKELTIQEKRAKYRQDTPEIRDEHQARTTKYIRITEEQMEEVPKTHNILMDRLMFNNEYKLLDKDEIVDIYADMILNKSHKLKILACNLLYLHLNQFAYILGNIRRIFFVTGQKEKETYAHIVELENLFKIRVGNKLTTQEDILKQILNIFIVPEYEPNMPGLIEICYTKYSDYKCKTSLRWKKDKMLRNQKIMEAEEENVQLTSFDIVATNQELLRNSKVHITILNFLEKNALIVKTDLQNQVIDYCFDFLYYFIKNHEENTKSLTTDQWIEMLFALLENKRFIKKVIRILTELIRSNYQANILVKDEYIKKIINKAKDYDSELFCDYLKLLQVLTESENGVMKEKQKIIIQTIDKVFKSILPKLLFNSIVIQSKRLTISDEIYSERKNAELESAENLIKCLQEQHLEVERIGRERNELLIDYEGFPDRTQMNYQCPLFKHLQFINLVGLCVKGKHLAIEKISLNFIPLSIIKKVVFNTDLLPLYIRLPYLLLLRGVCLSVEQSSDLIQKLGTAKRLDEYIKYFTSSAVFDNSPENENISYTDKFIQMTKEWTEELRRFLKYFAEKEQIIDDIINKGKNGDKTQFSEEEKIITDIKCEFGNYIVMDVILPIISDIFQTKNLKRVIMRIHKEGRVMESENLDEEEAETGDHEELYETFNEDTPIVKLLSTWINLIKRIGESHLILSSETRRVIVLNLLSVLKKNYYDKEEVKLRDFLEKNVKEKQELENMIIKLKLLKCEDMEEDIQIQNQKMRLKFIKKKCFPKLTKITSQAILNENLHDRDVSENDKNQIRILLQYLGDERMLPEFYYSMKYFREKLFKYALFRNHEDLDNVCLNKTFGANFYSPKTLSRNTDYVSTSEIVEEGDIKVEKNSNLECHPKFGEYSLQGGKLVINIIEQLKNLKIKAHVRTDTGFIKIMQAILILQGATLDGCAEQIEEEKYIFKVDDQDDKPEKLAIVQNLFSHLNIQELLLILISKAFESFGEKNQYYARLLIESIKLGLTMIAYSNKSVQNSFMESYKDSLVNLKPGYNFLQGIKKILSVGKKNFLGVQRNFQVEKTYRFSCMFIHNLCEGQNQEMKEFLREQQYIRVDVNIVSILAKACSSMVNKMISKIIFVDYKISKIIRKNYIVNKDRLVPLIDWSRTDNLPEENDFRILNQLLKAMTELSQGPCLKNQSAFILATIRPLCVLLQCIGSYFYECRINGKKFRGNNIDMEIILEEVKKLDITVEEMNYGMKFKREKSKRVTDEEDKAKIDLIEQQLNLNFGRLFLEMEGAILTFIKSLIEGRTSAMSSEAEHRVDMEHLADFLDPDIIIENLNTHMNHNYPKPIRPSEKHKEEKMRRECEGKRITHEDWKIAEQKKIDKEMEENLKEEKDEAFCMKDIRNTNIFHYYSFLTLYQEINSSEIGNKITTKFEMWKEIENEKPLREHGLEKIMGRCEILNNDRNLEVVYFPIPTIVNKYWEKGIIQTQIDELLSEVTRENPEEKVRDYMRMFEDIIKQVRHRESISKFAQNHLPKAIGTFLDYSLTAKPFWLFLTICIILCLNGFLLFAYKVEVQCPDEYLLNDGSCLEGKSTTELVQEVGDNDTGFQWMAPFAFFLFFMMIFVQFINFTFLDIIRDLQQYQVYEGKQSYSNNPNKRQKANYRFWQAGYILKNIFMDQNLVFYIIMFVVLLIGMNWVRSLIAITMLLILYEGKLSKYILTSVFDHWDTFLITLAVGVICIYWFSVISFFSSWRAEYGLEDQMACDTLWNCFRVHVDYGFMAFPVWDEAPVPYKAVAFNFLWVLVCNLCLTAIISGIIIDSFGEKRAKRDEMADDNNNFCFICNFERDEFERNQIDYEDHIKHYHYMWHYIWLIMHLEDKPREDYTGAEEYIWQLYSKKNIMFFPIKQCLQMQNLESTKQKSLRDLFEKVTIGFKAQGNQIEQAREEIESLSNGLKVQNIELGKEMKEMKNTMIKQMNSIEKLVSKHNKKGFIDKVTDEVGQFFGHKKEKKHEKDEKDEDFISEAHGDYGDDAPEPSSFSD